MIYGPKWDLFIVLYFIGFSFLVGWNSGFYNSLGPLCLYLLCVNNTRGTHQLLAYTDDVNILGGSIRTLKENVEALVAATREIGMEVSDDKTKYMVMSRDQNAGRIHSLRMDNNTFERVKEFKYLGRNLKNQNYIAEEIKSRLRSGNACYHSVQHLLSSRLLSKNLKIKIYRNIILLVVL